jgi:hypothetical protein
MYLAALKGRLGDASGAAATLDRAGVRGPARTWLDRAARQLEAAPGRYQVPEDTPAELVSASDDDPYVAPPPTASKVLHRPGAKTSGRERPRETRRNAASRLARPR